MILTGHPVRETQTVDKPKKDTNVVKTRPVAGQVVARKSARSKEVCT